MDLCHRPEAVGQLMTALLVGLDELSMIERFPPCVSAPLRVGSLVYDAYIVLLAEHYVQGLRRSYVLRAPIAELHHVDILKQRFPGSEKHR